VHGGRRTGQDLAAIMIIQAPEPPRVKTSNPMRLLFALPGLHRVNRGAEVAFESVAAELARRPDCEVTLIGSGEPRPAQPYRFVRASCRSREHFERWPRIPVFRNHYVYEELTFIPGLWSAFHPDSFDATVTCSYPFVNWALRAKRRGGRPLHVFVTQNGDWPPALAGASIGISPATAWCARTRSSSSEIAGGGGAD